MSKPAASNQLQPLQQPPPHMHFSQFNVPHVQSTNAISSHSASQPHSISFQQPMGAQIIAGHSQATVLGPGFIEAGGLIEQPQFFAAIPVQPMIPTSATVLSPIQPALDYSLSNVSASPSQSHIQEHLQRKHEELQKLIVQQQDELRRLSEQLFMARYGIIPSIMNVSFPVPATSMDQAEPCAAGPVNPLQVHHQNFPDQNPQMVSRQLHPHQQIPQIQIHQPVSAHQQQFQQQPQHYDINSQKVESQMASEQQQQNDDIMQYMHHQSIHQPNTPQSSVQDISHPQQALPNDDFELMPFQMLNQQAQILFSSGDNDNNGVVGSSNLRKK